MSCEVCCGTRVTDEKTPPPLSTQAHFKLHIVVKRNEGKTLLGA